MTGARWRRSSSYPVSFVSLPFTSQILLHSAFCDLRFCEMLYAALLRDYVIISYLVQRLISSINHCYFCCRHHGAYVCTKDYSWQLEYRVTPSCRGGGTVSVNQSQSSCEWLWHSGSNFKVLCQERTQWLSAALGSISTSLQRRTRREVSHIPKVELGKRHFGMTKLQVRKFAYEYANKNGLQHCFHDESKMAGVNWVTGFLKCHKEITLWVPEMTSLRRIMGFNKPQVKLFLTCWKLRWKNTNLCHPGFSMRTRLGCRQSLLRFPKCWLPKEFNA